MKYDGYRMQAQLNDGVGRFLSRNEIDWSNKFPHLLNSLEKIDVSNAIFDGEVVLLDEHGRSHFQDLQNFLKAKKDRPLSFFVFDLLYLNGRDLRSEPLLRRKEILQDLLRKVPDEIRFSEHLEESGSRFFEISCEHGLEGVVSKLLNSPYVSGRNELWVKAKCKLRQEFVIGGWTEAQGGRSHFGSLLLGIYDHGKLRYVGRVGTGFSESSLKEISKELKPLELESSPFTESSPKKRGIHWVKPLKVCEVSFANWTDDSLLRAPVFQGLREDKEPREIRREESKKMKKKSTTELKITSLEKILYPKEKLTKGQVFEYYQKVSRLMLPHLRDRPLSLVRCPQGVGGKCFFQKHLYGKVSESLRTFPVKEKDGEEIYFSVSSEEGLKELIQLNAFELHSWNCRAGKLMNPDQIVMDFDPGPGVIWRDVITGAMELKNILLDLKLESFVKLTGGKGLHVHVPIAPIYSWDEVKLFSETLAQELASRHPTKYTLTMSKRVRRGKIFIDYLRNGYGATAVVPYSLRARPISSVALPMAWEELKKIKDPSQFTLERALRKLKNRRKDPWRRMPNLRQRITILNSSRR